MSTTNDETVAATTDTQVSSRSEAFLQSKEQLKGITDSRSVHPLSKTVQFVEGLVTETNDTFVDYDRTSTPIQVFSCDICSQAIRAGLRGFEPYCSCDRCEFDVCTVCCPHAIRKKKTVYSPCQPPATIQSKLHEHALEIVDRGAQVHWANGHSKSTKKKKTKTKAKSRATKATTKPKGEYLQSLSPSASTRTLETSTKCSPIKRRRIHQATLHSSL